MGHTMSGEIMGPLLLQYKSSQRCDIHRMLQTAVGLYSSDNSHLTSQPTWGAPLGKVMGLLTVDDWLFSVHNFLG